MDEIEERMAHLERANDELSDVVAEQSRRIVRLEAQIGYLIERERGREEGHSFTDERPPHW